MTHSSSRGVDAADSNERGAMLVEFALIAPVFIMLVMGIVQFGLVLNQKQGLHAAAREGSRTASLPTSSSQEVEQRVSDAMAGVALSDAYTVVITPSGPYPCENRTGQSVEVMIEAEAELDIPFFSGQTVDLESVGVFRCE